MLRGCVILIWLLALCTLAATVANVAEPPPEGAEWLSCNPPGKDQNGSVLVLYVLQDDLMECELRGTIPSGKKQQFAFKYPVSVLSIGFDLLLVLKSYSGDTDIALRETGTNRVLDTVQYSGEELLFASRTFFQQNTTYILELSAPFAASNFSLMVSTPPAPRLLIRSEQQVLLRLKDSCCPKGPAEDGSVCQKLQRTLGGYGPGYWRGDDVPMPPRCQGPHFYFCDLCMEPYIICSPTGFLRHLNLSAPSGKGLKCKGGGLPHPFGPFSELEMLDLSNNDLSISLFEFLNILDAPKLRRLRVQNTNLSGPLPCPTLDRLESVWLADNRLRGPLPECMLGSPRLVELVLSSNQLAGELPDVIPRGSPLYILSLDGQKGEPSSSSSRGFKGRLPTSLLNAERLMWLDISGSSLTGSLPELPKAIRNLYLENNDLSGPIPKTFADLTELRVLSLSENEFTGRLPELPSDLRALYLEKNQLIGPFPNSYAQLKNLVWLFASNNLLNGTLPALPTSLQVVELQNNFLSGSIPPSLSLLRNLVYLDLSDNLLRGAIPSGLLRMQYLEIALLSGNLLTALPEDPWSAPVLTWLDLSSNNISGSLPSSLAVLPALTILNLSNNRIQGGLTDFASALLGSNVLTRVDLSNNQLEGPVPPRLSNLGVFHVENATLSIFGNEMTMSNYLGLSNNRLSGEFPFWLLELLVGSPPGTLVGLQGNALLTCPPKGFNWSADTEEVQRRRNFTCLDVLNNRVVPLDATPAPPAPNTHHQPNFVRSMQQGRIVEILGLTLLGASGVIVVGLVVFFTCSRCASYRRSDAQGGAAAMTRSMRSTQMEMASAMSTSTSGPLPQPPASLSSGSQLPSSGQSSGSSSARRGLRQSLWPPPTPRSSSLQSHGLVVIAEDFQEEPGGTAVAAGPAGVGGRIPGGPRPSGIGEEPPDVVEGHVVSGLDADGVPQAGLVRGVPVYIDGAEPLSYTQAQVGDAEWGTTQHGLPRRQQQQRVAGAGPRRWWR